MAGEKILVIDDESDFALLLSIDIKKRGYQVVLAGNGEEGLSKVKTEKPALVIFDIKMPKMDGYTFVKTIKKDPELSKIPLIALTSYQLKDMFEIEGVKDYFMKAAKMEGLFETIAARLSSGKPQS